MIKKLLLTLAVGLSIVCASKAQVPADQILAGTLTTPAGVSNNLTWIFSITTNRANVHAIQLSSAATGIVQFYDSNNTNAPFLGINYTNNTYWTQQSYTTNLVSTYISPLTGTTNVFTNSGVYTYYVTNSPGTNALPTKWAAAFTANVPSIQNGLNLTFANGITMRTTTNVNYSIWYTP